ncbi:unnamed protein product [Periconia digitata]|uniref:Uncharacterized protein n=1 Tax=Periconia digitata TaxID=1303443 RepID=A0A9W4UM22_9PLEO|nr:unnamed protein product [Periconia digitata]
MYGAESLFFISPMFPFGGLRSWLWTDGSCARDRAIGLDKVCLLRVRVQRR